MNSGKVPSGPRKATFVFIFATVLLDVLALGIIIPVLPKLVEGFAGGDASRGARVYGLFGTVWALMQFIFSPLLGALSDRFGRRPVILVSCFGLGLDYLLMAVAPTLAWLFVGRVLSGITAASFSTAGAYIADVTAPEKRAGAFGLLGAAWGIGFILGPAMGGLLGGISPRLPFWVAGGLSLANALYGVFVLPESLPRDRRSGFSWKRANPVGSLSLLRSHATLLGLAAVNALNQLAHQVFPSVFVLYASHRFGWSERMIGGMLAVVGVCNTVVQAGLVRPAVRWMGERSALAVGLVFGAAGFATYGLARTEWVFWLAVPVYALMGLFGPSLQGLMTRRVGASEQGRLQGANGSIMGMTGMLGPWLFTEVYARGVASSGGGWLPGAPFVLAALLLAVALPVAMVSTRVTSRAAAG